MDRKKSVLAYYLDVWTPKLNFFWLHLLYILLLSIVGSGILYAQEEIRYIDALFMSVSSLSSGLTSVNFHHFTRRSQVMVFFWMIIGSPVFVSLIPLFAKVIYSIRKYGPKALATKAVTLLFAASFLFCCLVCLVTAIVLGLYLQFSSAYRVVHKENETPWWAWFYTFSGFTSSGFALFSDSLIPFAKDRLVTLLLSQVIILGQIGLPIFLWLFVAIGIRITSGDTRAALEAVKECPRKFTYNMFPVKVTLLYIGAWFFVALFEFFVFFVEWNRSLFSDFNTGDKLLVFFGQTAAVRTAGFNYVDFADLLDGHIFMYVVTMYLSCLPLILAIRATTIGSYKKRNPALESKNLLSRDLLWLGLAVLIITFIEEDRRSWKPSKIQNPFLALMLEVMSGFTLVGFSVGFPGTAASYSAVFHTVSKLIVIFVMFLGRHKGLPFSDDMAVCLDSCVSVGTNVNVNEEDEKPATV